MAIVAGSAVKLAAEHPGEGLLRDVAQIHGDIKIGRWVVRNASAASSRRRWRI